MKDQKSKKITLLSVEFCNCKCLYCYEINKHDSAMTFETAKSILDSEIARFGIECNIQIEFIGGEPFLPDSFKLFKQVIAYIDEFYPDYDITYVVTTNGTLVHGEVQDFLIKNSSKISLSLSLDGRAKSHNLNRMYLNGKGIFADIDIVFFQNYPIPVNAKMTVSPLTLNCLADDIFYVSEELGFTATATFATGIDWENDYNPYELIQQLGILVDHYSKYPHLELPRMLQVELPGVFATPDPFLKPCSAGENTRTFTPDCKDPKTDWYPCQGLAPITVGSDNAKQFFNSTFSEFQLKEPCASCRFRALCPSCQATNFGVTGDVTKQSTVMCLLNRLLALASSNIQYNHIISKGIDNLTKGDQLVLNAIEIIQSEIFDLDKNEFLWNTPLTC